MSKPRNYGQPTRPGKKKGVKKEYFIVVDVTSNYIKNERSRLLSELSKHRPNSIQHRKVKSELEALLYIPKGAKTIFKTVSKGQF